MRRKSIRNKILLWVGLCMFTTLGIVVAYTSITTRGIALDSAKQSVSSMAREDANEIALVIGGALDTARTLANALSTVKSAHAGLTRETVDSMLRAILERNPDFVAANHCTGFEVMARLQQAFQGRFIPAFVGETIDVA